MRMCTARRTAPKPLYKRECQEKYFPAELKARPDWLAFSPLWLDVGVCSVCVSIPKVH